MDIKDFVEIYECEIEEKLNVSVKVVESIYNESEQENDALVNEFSRKNIDSLNGRILFPKSIDGHYKILLNKKIFNGNYNFLCTIFHELTHVWDYTNLFKYLNIDKVNDASDYKYFDIFKLWMEFHASLLGETISYNILQKLSIIEKDNYEWNKSEELPYMIKYMNEVSKKNENDLGMQLYYFFIYFGKICFWHDLYPEHYPRGKVQYLLANDNRLMKLYDFCNQNRDFFAAINKMEQVREVLMGDNSD